MPTWPTRSCPSTTSTPCSRAACHRAAEMPVSAADFLYVRQLVRQESAVSLDDGKEYLVETRLTPLAERAGLGSVGDLIDHLRAGAPGLRQHVVEALVTHE